MNSLIVIGDTAVAMRRAPSESASQIAELMPGEIVMYTGREMNSFLEVSMGEKTGFVLKKYLSAPDAAIVDVRAEGDEASSDTSWNATYKDFLLSGAYVDAVSSRAELSQIGFAKGRADDAAFILHDLDEDEVPELILIFAGSDGNDSITAVFTCQEGQPTYLDAFVPGCYLFVAPRDRTRYKGVAGIRWLDSGTDEIIYAELKNHALSIERVSKVEYGSDGSVRETKVCSDDGLYALFHSESLTGFSEDVDILPECGLSGLTAELWDNYIDALNVQPMDEGQSAAPHEKAPAQSETSQEGAEEACSLEPAPTEKPIKVVTVDGLDPQISEPEEERDAAAVSQTSEVEEEREVAAASRLRVVMDCNLREAPGLDNAKLSVAHEGDILDSTGRTGEDGYENLWYEVLFGIDTGWIASRYVEPADEAEYGTSDDEPDDEPVEDKIGDYYAPKMGSVVMAVSGNTNVRTGPGLNYPTQGVLNRHSSLPFTGGLQYDERGVAWYSVEWEGGTSWVSSRYTEIR